MRFLEYIKISESPATIVDFASKFAEIKHQKQRRKFSDEPYFKHPERVANIVKKFKNSHNIDQLLSAAFLHDTIEDTNTTYKDLQTMFGGLVASLVKELSSDPEEIKKMGKTEYLTQKMENMSNWALVIKLADRLDNLSDIKTSSGQFRDKMIKSTKIIIRDLESHRTLTSTQKKLVELIKQKLKEGEE